MTKENHIVTEQDIRPARPDGTCFYCRAPLHQQHNLGCVCRTKTIIVEVTILLLQQVPEDWDKDLIESRLNGEGSSCQSNVINAITQQQERLDAKQEDLGNGVTRGPCMCGSVKGTFLRDATQDDEDFYGVPE